MKQANSFDGTAVADALSGREVKTIRGTIQFRSCDHQAMIPVFIGKVADTVDPVYGFPLIVNSHKIAPENMVMPCEMAVSLQKK